MTREDKAYNFIDKIKVRVPGTKLRKISNLQKEISNHSKEKANAVTGLIYGRNVDGSELSTEDRKFIADVYRNHRKARLSKIEKLKTYGKDLMDKANKARDDKYLNADAWHKTRSITMLKRAGAYTNRPK